MRFFKPHITPTGRPHEPYTIGWWFHRLVTPFGPLRRAWYYINDVWPAWRYGAAGPPSFTVTRSYGPNGIGDLELTLTRNHNQTRRPWRIQTTWQDSYSRGYRLCRFAKASDAIEAFLKAWLMPNDDYREFNVHRLPGGRRRGRNPRRRHKVTTE